MVLRQLQQRTLAASVLPNGVLVVGCGDVSGLENYW